MRTSLFKPMHGGKNQLKMSISLTAVLSLSLIGCSSIKTPDSLKSLRLPESIKRISLPNLGISENDPSFRKRIYAGGGFGQSSIKPDTRGTVFNVSNSSALATQFRLGVDMHNRFSFELGTSVLGKAQFAEGHNTDVSYTSASINALFYGLTGNRNRSSRQGFSGYGRIGYGVVQHGSIVEPFDYSKKSLMLGIGAEYGFQNRIAVRTEVTRLASDATVFGIGGIYRFGMPPSSIGKVFANATAPALGAANARTEVRNGKVFSVNDRDAVTASHVAKQENNEPGWMHKVSASDLDGDGVRNSADRCQNSALNSTVSKTGCGLFDAILSDVTFKPGSDWLSPRARGSLDKLATTLLAFPEARVQVRAHTDNRGAADENVGLSARRANSVVAYLMAKGIGELQLETLGLGETQPLDTNDTKAGRKRNRRVELLTLSNIDSKTLLDTSPQLGAASAGPEPKSIVPLRGAVSSARSVRRPAAALPSATRAVAAVVKPQFGEPIFPSMPGVKIEPLPQSKYVAGLSLGGILNGVEFLDSSATLTDASSTQLRLVRQELANFPSVRLLVIGHTDNQLSPEESKALSITRANAVVNFLVTEGVNASRLSVEGFGSSLPLAQNVTEVDRRRNHRIELRVIN